MEKKSKITIITLSVVSAVLAVALIASAIMSLSTQNVLNGNIDNAAAEKQALLAIIKQHEDKLKEYEGRMDELSTNIEENIALIAQKEAGITSLEGTIASLNAEMEKLISEGLVDDERVMKLTERINILTDAVTQAKADKKKLEQEIDGWKSMLTMDIGEQAEIVTELFTLLATGAPNRVVTDKDKTDENVTATTEETVEKYPVMSLLYIDLASGYTIGYNEDLIRYSASLIKLPYIYALIREIDDYERDRFFYDDDGKPLYDELGNALYEGDHPHLDESGKLTYPEGEEKYDLDTVWTFDKETMMVDGSGKIQTLEDGTKLTYRELIEYTILYSDNIAFDQLQKIFGYNCFYSLVYRLKLEGAYKGFMMMSATDCGKVLAELYEYDEANEKYGKYLTDLMAKSNYNWLISGGVDDFIDVSHKYGWDNDSYHDMAIIWDERPYLLVIMSDLDDGRTEDVKYFHGLSAVITKLHHGFYKYYDKLTVSPEAPPTDSTTEK